MALGATIVSVVVLVSSRSSWAVTLATAWPGPTIWSRTDCSELSTWLSYWSVSLVRSLLARSAETALSVPSPAAESRWPWPSTTVTSEESIPSMLEETRCTMLCTCCWVSWAPCEVLTSTEALGFCESSRKTSCCGMARCTIAVWTPPIASMVLSSSPSIARW